MSDEPIRAREAARFACGSGLKHFCAASGLDYQTFLRKGYSIERLRAIDDVNCQRVLDEIIADREARKDG